MKGTSKMTTAQTQIEQQQTIPQSCATVAALCLRVQQTGDEVKAGRKAFKDVLSQHEAYQRAQQLKRDMAKATEQTRKEIRTLVETAKIDSADCQPNDALTVALVRHNGAKQRLASELIDAQQDIMPFMRTLGVGDE
jgi:hypothetical protein